MSTPDQPGTEPMTDPDHTRRASDNTIRLADEERQRVTGQVQDDRRTDAPPERARTTEQIRVDRQHDLHLTTDQIQQDRRDDEAPRTALELVRADKLTASLVLLDTVRKMCMALLAVMVVLGVAMVFMFDYMGDNRARIDTLRTEIAASNEATGRVEKAFTAFSDNNQAYLDNHSRTQRLICDWYRANDVALPANGDCNNR